MATAELDSAGIDETFAEESPPTDETHQPTNERRAETRLTSGNDRWYILPNSSSENRFFRHRIFRLIHDGNTQEYIQLSAQNDGISGSTVLLRGGILHDAMKYWTTLTAPEDVDRVAGQLLRKYLAILNGKQRHGSGGTVE
ncbi:MAG: hypothetical protein WCS85_04720 [Candidatus Peribacteraceae bacterium]|jgi:hypothetical protein